MTDRSELTPRPHTSAAPPVREPEITPTALVTIGAVIAVVGGGLALLGGNAFVAFLAYAAGVVGAVLVLVGAVAAGVRLGIHWARYDRIL